MELASRIAGILMAYFAVSSFFLRKKVGLATFLVAATGTILSLIATLALYYDWWSDFTKNLCA